MMYIIALMLPPLAVLVRGRLRDVLMHVLLILMVGFVIIVGLVAFPPLVAIGWLVLFWHAASIVRRHNVDVDQAKLAKAIENEWRKER